MPTRHALIAFALLAGCGTAEPVALDIDEVSQASSPGGAPAAPGSVPLNVNVRAGQLGDALDAGGGFTLKLFDCKTPDAAGTIAPLYFGGEPIAEIARSQLSDDPEMLVLLSAAAPRKAVEGPGKCARLIARDGAPEVVGQAVELRAN